MDRRDAIKWRFAIFLVAIPALIHVFFGGLYAANADAIGRAFWMPFVVSTTIPYVFLALLFLAHCGRLKLNRRRSAYCGAVLAWLAMMVFSISLVSPTHSRIGPTGATLTIALTPFCYLPFLFGPYVFGAIIGMFWNDKWKDDKLKREE
jgi:hypothetical protein